MFFNLYRQQSTKSTIGSKPFCSACSYSCPSEIFVILDSSFFELLIAKTFIQYLVDLVTFRLCNVLILPPPFIAHRCTHTRKNEQLNISLASNCACSLALLQSYSDRLELYNTASSGKNVLKCVTYRTKHLTCVRNRG